MKGMPNLSGTGKGLPNLFGECSPRTVKQLFAEFPLEVYSPLPDILLQGISSDSRQVQPGDLFVALQGANFDAHRYIPQAAQRGAVAAVGVLPPNEIASSLPYIQVSDSRRGLAHLAAAFYGFPARRMRMVGVTGTDGKTTTVNLIYAVLQAAGLRAGMISTVNAVIGDQVLDTGFHVTTPDAPEVQRYLAMMVESGMTHAVLETTSHGWAQFRVDACEFDIGVITNITHEHLNDHGTFENYRAAKARLFHSLAETAPKLALGEQSYTIGQPGLAVLNHDDSSYAYLASVLAETPQVRLITYGLHQGEVRAENIRHSPGGLCFDLQGPGWAFEAKTRLVGEYNVSNCLAAVAAAVVGLGLPPQAAQVGLVALLDIPGRMEIIHLGQDFLAIVDFAHTPNALSNVLQTVRQMTSGKVIVVFGSAGLRDQQKRVMMAEIAARLADLTILTAEDPRTESLDDILVQMAAAAASRDGIEGQTFWRVPDRGQAIQFALSLASPGDAVLACGKGHEQSMCFGTVEYPWDDRTAMQAGLANLLGVQGPAMPLLPTSLVIK